MFTALKPDGEFKSLCIAWVGSFLGILVLASFTHFFSYQSTYLCASDY